jgi:membrane-associated phospholipid phosphatase
MTRGLALDFALTGVIKLAVGRDRPDYSNRLSFPSGHTSFAFAGSTVLARRCGWPVGLPA